MDYDKLYKLLGKYTDSFIRMKIPKKLTITLSFKFGVRFWAL